MRCFLVEFCCVILGWDWMTHNCAKTEKYLFSGISGCNFGPCTGARWILMSRGFRICTGNFQSVLRYKKGTDQKPPITRHFWPPTLFCHTYSGPSGYEDSPGPPVNGPKLHPEMPGNKYFSTFWQLWVIQSPLDMLMCNYDRGGSQPRWIKLESSFILM